MNPSQFNKYKSFLQKILLLMMILSGMFAIPIRKILLSGMTLMQIFPEKSQAVREAKLLIQALQPDQAMMNQAEAGRFMGYAFE
jgi:hypothetical protein